jgi:hypothetical protein
MKSKNQKLTDMNKKSVKPVKVRFCPECKATNVNFVFRLQNMFGSLPRVECNDCKYSAVEFPLLVVEKEKLNAKNKKISTKKKVARRKKK